METKRKKYDLLKAQLDNEQSSFIPHWRDLGTQILPRRPRFFTSDVNKGDKRNSAIIDSTATLAARTLRSGMMGGVTSPARPWFRLTTPDPGVSEMGAVKEWLHTVSQRMSTIFLRSNLYQVLPGLYGDLGVFGTAAMMIEEDFKSIIRCHLFPIGSYKIAYSDQQKIEVFFRDFRMTVRQVLQTFGTKMPNGEYDPSNLSEEILNAWKNGHTENWVDICHVIKPNDDYDPNKLSAKHKKYISCYYEAGSGDSSIGYAKKDMGDKFLRESGYDYFPVLAPRWEITGEDIYGTSCPGMEALGDIKQLQLGEKRGMQAIEKMVNPPMTGPAILKTQAASILPGHITYVDTREGQQGFRPAHEVNPRIQELEMKQDQVRNRIRRAFYEDLFLMLANTDRRQITAREIEERHEEKLLALGPVLEQLNQDLLDPLIDNTFNIMLKQSQDANGEFFENGMIPKPPDALQGMDLKVEYISVMAQAQKLAGIASLERFYGFVGQLAAVSPSVLDKVDLDQSVDEYGDITGVPPRVIRSDEDVEELRAQKAKAEQQARAAETVPAMAKTAKDLSGADLSGDNALSALLRQTGAGNLVPAA